MINKELENLNKSLQKQILEEIDKKNKEKAEMLETITKQINRENELINDLSFFAEWILSNAADRLRIYTKQYLEIVKKYDLEQYLINKNVLKLLKREAEK